MRALLMLGLAACSSSPGTFAIDGTVSGNAPPSGKVVFVWDAPQTPYKWGDGTSMGTTYTVSLAAGPPPQTYLAMTGVAVGIPMLIDETQTVADGPITLATTPHLGIATDYAVLYKNSTVETNANLPWVANFGASYSCAMCVRGGNGGKDSWQLVGCASVQIVVGASDTAICNWY